MTRHRTPLAGELAILKWLVIPVILLALLMADWFLRQKQHRCQEFAEDLGFVTGTYVPGGRSMPGKCVCEGLRLPNGEVRDETRRVYEEF